MLSTFLFLVFFSLYMWLYYKPHRTSSQHRRYDAALAATPSQTRSTARTPNTEAPPPIAELQQNEDKLIQIVDKRTPRSEKSLSVTTEEKLTTKTEPVAIRDTDADTDLEPILTEEEAIALAVETTLAKDTMTEVSIGEIEDSVPELMRPKPPDPELVEAAVRDAEEKFEDFSPPETGDK